MKYLLWANKQRGAVLVYKLVAAIVVDVCNFSAVDVEGHWVLVDFKFPRVHWRMSGVQDTSMEKQEQFQIGWQLSFNVSLFQSEERYCEILSTVSYFLTLLWQQQSRNIDRRKTGTEMVAASITLHNRELVPVHQRQHTKRYINLA